MAGEHDEEFVEFATASLPGLRRTGYLMCGDWHRAEDAAQEALIRVYRSWHRVERREGLLAYARRTTVRILIDESRRPCVVLRYYHDLSVAETARALGCSEGTVKSQTSDALRALRPLFGDVVDARSPR
jgi:DNA-directed RNA polymerase specialized sigma24 family protein